MTKSAIRTLLNGIKALIPPAQVQADYKNNNSNTPSYVKNRPFYKDGDELKQLEEEFVPPISTDNVYFDSTLSEKYKGSTNVKEGLEKIVDEVYEKILARHVISESSYSIRVVGSNEELLIGISDGGTGFYKSKDGVNWEYINLTTKDTNFNYYDTKAVYLKNTWIIHDYSKAFYSKDLKEWQPINFPIQVNSILSTFYEARGKIYGCIKNGALFFICSDDGLTWEVYNSFSIIGEYEANDFSAFACNDYGFITARAGRLFHCSFEKFNLWEDSYININISNNLSSINNVFYAYNPYEIVFLYQGVDSSLQRSTYRFSEYNMIEKGLVAYKDGYYIFHNNPDFGTVQFIYTKDFLNYSSKKSSIGYGGDVLYATKTLLSSGNYIITGPRNELGLATEKELNDIKEILENHIEDSEKALNELEKTIGQDFVVLKDSINGFNYILRMQNGNLISHCKYVSISIGQLPNKYSYKPFDEFNPEGMIVYGTSEDGSTSEVLSYEYEKTIPMTSSLDYNLPITVTQGKEKLKCYVPLQVENPYVDFVCNINGDNTVTILSWRGTYNGQPSTKCILPDVEGTIL